MDSELVFEISDTPEYFIRLEPIEFNDYDADNYWDRNWVRTKITARGGRFSGDFCADLMTVDFRQLRQNLALLYDNLNGSTRFSDLEGYLSIEISGDGFGHFAAKVLVAEKPNYGGELRFELSFDQTQIKNYLNQLGEILEKFPITGLPN